MLANSLILLEATERIRTAHLSITNAKNIIFIRA